MNDSWIAIANADGLYDLIGESGHALAFAQRRAFLQNAECFWVVLRSEHVRFIQRQLHQHEPRIALLWLVRLAQDAGRILRPYDELPEWQSDEVTNLETCGR